MTRDLDRSDLAGLVEAFEVTAYNAVVDGGGRVVKTLGDEVMWTCDSVLAAARIALELAEAFGRDNPVPPVRVGVAYGPALARAGDVLGPVVNLASRCTTLARPGAVLVDKALADALEQARADNPEEVTSRCTPCGHTACGDSAGFRPSGCGGRRRPTGMGRVDLP